MIEGLNDFVFFGAVSIATVFFVIGINRVVLRRGLVVRIFGIMAPTIGIIGYLGFVLGKLETLTTMIVCLTAAGAVGSLAVVLFNRMVARHYKVQLEALTRSVTSISDTARYTAAAVADQATAVHEVTATVEELEKMGRHAAETAANVLIKTAEAVTRGTEGSEKIAEAARIMLAVAQVKEVVDSVNELAEQSNLLAVNAGIEAAKAGDFGRGFSVVASEVRELAEQSKAAVNLIRDAVNRTDEGRRAIETVQQVIYSLAETLDVSADHAREISDAVSQQSAGIRQINDVMSNLSKGGRQTAEATHQLESAMADLSKIGDQLRVFVMG